LIKPSHIDVAFIVTIYIAYQVEHLKSLPSFVSQDFCIAAITFPVAGAEFS